MEEWKIMKKSVKVRRILQTQTWCFCLEARQNLYLMEILPTLTAYGVNANFLLTGVLIWKVPECWNLAMISVEIFSEIYENVSAENLADFAGFLVKSKKGLVQCRLFVWFLVDRRASASNLLDSRLMEGVSVANLWIYEVLVEVFLYSVCDLISELRLAVRSLLKNTRFEKFIACIQGEGSPEATRVCWSWPQNRIRTSSFTI